MSDTVVSLFQYMGHQSKSSVHSASTGMTAMTSQGIDHKITPSSGPGKVTMLVIVDPSTGDRYNPAEEVEEGAKVILLHPDRDGVEQMTEALQVHAGVTCLHVICDSSGGNLQLGSSQLGPDNLDAYGWQLQHWAELLGPKAEIFLYCSPLAKGDRGRALSQQIGLLTGATVKVL